MAQKNHLTFPIRSDKFMQSVLIEEHLLHEETPFQTIDIYNTQCFGKVLMLDGHIQLTALDEHVYHEALVQIPLLNLESPTSALVVGGGDGAVVREIIKHKSIERVDMVEIDEAVVKASVSVWPELSNGAFGDPRLHLHIADAFKFVKAATQQYDLIVMDSTDVYEEEDQSLSEMLFTEEFYRDLRRLLKPGGFVVTQADNLVFCPYSLEEIQKMYAKAFDKVGSYFAVIPSFGGYSGYCWASLGQEISSTWEGLRKPEFPLRYLNEAAYNYGFAPLPFGL
ncbi:MAG: hypothetical protein KF784_11730 [Fimbriimonadaceae bacterium]|nr:hypothetical protein [Fimbriimonadaceae bacterium]